MTDKGQEVHPGCQKPVDDPFLLKGFAIHHEDNLFLLLRGIHHGGLLGGGYLILGEDLGLAHITGHHLCDEECVLHFVVGHPLL